MGEFTITAYCACVKCCGKGATGRTASGTTATAHRTIAVGRNVLPFGTKVKIGSYGIFVVEDRPAEWIVKRYNGKIVDMYFDNHQEAINFGKRKLKLWIVEE